MGLLSNHQQKMKYLVLLACAVAFASALTLREAELRKQFNNFKIEHNKHYSNAAEEQARFLVFKENYLSMERHNKMGHKWQKGINQFSDLTPQEFQANHLNGHINL